MTSTAITGRRARTIVAVAILTTVALSAAGLAVAYTTGSGIPPEKQQLLDQERADRASAPTATEADSGPPAPPHLPPRSPGINNSGLNLGPFPAAVFTVRNVWNGPVQGSWYLVYAGGLPGTDGNITGGEIRIYSLPSDPNAVDQTLRFVGEYPSSTPDAVKVVSVHGRSMTLSTDSAHTLSFDLSTKAFG